jgi:hypothetical protein
VRYMVLFIMLGACTSEVNDPAPPTSTVYHAPAASQAVCSGTKMWCIDGVSYFESNTCQVQVDHQACACLGFDYTPCGVQDSE